MTVFRLETFNWGSPSGWLDGVISHFFKVWFVKQQNNFRDGMKVKHGAMVWLAFFTECDSWNSNIIGVMVWKWCIGWWRDRLLFLGVNREFHLSFTGFMKDEKVKKKVLRCSRLIFLAYYLSCKSQTDKLL